MSLPDFNPDHLPRITLVDEAYEIPRLKKTRRVAVLCPHDYGRSDRRYPVLYLQDGQNLADDHAPYGNWAVDKRLAALVPTGAANVIVVAIDHAEQHRINEFSPFSHPAFGAGEGAGYVAFLTDTLKPYVDRNFRTLPDRIHTGVGGSSMGGLISLYAALTRPEVFSKAMVFSPSLWLASRVYALAATFQPPPGTRVYLYGGEQESVDMISSLRRLGVALGRRCTHHLHVSPHGRHNEASWGEAFAPALRWLFFPPA